MWFLLPLLLSTVVAGAQADQSCSDIQRLIPVLENQRNTALTNHALTAAKLAKLEEDFAKLKTEFEEFVKKGGK